MTLGDRRWAWFVPAALVWAWYLWFAVDARAEFFMEDAAYLSHGTIRSVGDLVATWTQPPGTRVGFNFRPATTTFYGVLAGIFGLKPIIFRVANLVLLALTAGVLSRLFTRLGFPASWSGCLLATWMLSPAVPNLVYWGVGSFDLLAGLFGTIALFVAMSAAGWGAAVVTGHLFLFACFAKESCVGLLVLLVAAAGLRLGREHAFRVGACSAIAAAVWFAAFSQVADPVPLPNAWALLVALVHYSGWLLILPSTVGAMYHEFEPSSFWPAAQGALVIAGWLAVGLVRAGWQDWGRWWLVGGLGAGVLLVAPALAVPTFHVEPVRYLYLPFTLALPALSAGLYGMVAGLRSASVALVVALGGAALLVWQASYALPRPWAWINSGGLWEAECANDPNYRHAFFLATHLATKAGTKADFERTLVLLDQVEQAVPRDGRPLAVDYCAVASWRSYGTYCLERDAEAARVVGDAQSACSAYAGNARHPMYKGTSCIFARLGGTVDGVAMDADAACAEHAPACR